MMAGGLHPKPVGTGSMQCACQQNVNNVIGEDHRWHVIIHSIIGIEPLVWVWVAQTLWRPTHPPKNLNICDKKSVGLETLDMF